MATLYRSTGENPEYVAEVSLPDIEARLLKKGYGTTPDDISHSPGGNPPRFKPVTQWPDYVLIQVYDSEPKTKLFPESGWYHLRKLSAGTSAFLLEPKT